MLLVDDPELRQEVIESDDEGFTVRSVFKSDQAVMDDNARFRSSGPQQFRDKNSGATFTKFASIPMSIVHRMYMRLGRYPTAEELRAVSQHRDFSGCKTIDKTLSKRGDPDPKILLGDWR